VINWVVAGGPQLDVESSCVSFSRNRKACGTGGPPVPRVGFKVIHQARPPVSANISLTAESVSPYT